jgi:DNA replication and repair protein RecF
MLLDDVMSELDPDRRGRLVELLARGGQSLITTTEAEHVPAGGDQRHLLIEAGAVEPGPGAGG